MPALAVFHQRSFQTLPSDASRCSIELPWFRMTLAELRTTEREHILAIARHHGVTSVKVFGSFAHDQVRPDSDLDLLIEAGAITTPFFPGGLIADLEEALGRKVDVVEDAALHRSLRDRIHAEAVPL